MFIMFFYSPNICIKFPLISRFRCKCLSSTNYITKDRHDCCEVLVKSEEKLFHGLSDSNATSCLWIHSVPPSKTTSSFSRTHLNKPRDLPPRKNKVMYLPNLLKSPRNSRKNFKILVYNATNSYVYMH